MIRESEVGLTWDESFFASIKGRWRARQVEGCWIGRAKGFVRIERLREVREGGLLFKGLLRVLGEGSRWVGLSFFFGGDLVCC